MKIQSVVLRADGKHCVVLDDGSILERIVSLEASVGEDRIVRIKLETLMLPAPTYRATDAEREIDSLNLD